MSAQPRMKRLATIAFISTYLVVLAGSVVRMSGAGMGCPDWPRCFGLTIPPTDEAQVRWATAQDYVDGRMLIVSDSLWVAQANHTSGTAFDSDRSAGLWSHYTRHNYAQFNAVHTWTEFVNRLLGAWAGVPVTLLWLFSLFRIRRNRGLRIATWTTAAWILLGVVAWLGKLVVEGHLIPGSITIHMLGALGILLALLFARQDIVGRLEDARLPQGVKIWLAISTLLALAQLVLGTQVRESVDILVKAGVARGDWLAHLPSNWKIHRSLSWLLVATQLIWIFRVWRGKRGGSFWHRNASRMAGLLAAQMLTGLLFAWADMPAWSQPLHLMLGMGTVLLSASLWRAGRMAG
jgi:cytochrome c oxidase assembly protein subunit 15